MPNPHDGDYVEVDGAIKMGPGFKIRRDALDKMTLTGRT